MAIYMYNAKVLILLCGSDGDFQFFLLFFRMDGGVFLNGLGFLVEMSDSVCFYSDSHRRSKTHILQYSTFNVPR